MIRRQRLRAQAAIIDCLPPGKGDEGPAFWSRVPWYAWIAIAVAAVLLALL